MRIPWSWLKEYVDLSGLTPHEIARRLTMAGTEVGAIEPYGGSWEQVFVGHVEEVEPHPNAGRLRLCTVDFGGDRAKVVCGAPNVAAGQKIAYAKVGARLINPETGDEETLKAARIRGVSSEGMVCSERELGIGDDHSGILVLPEDAPVGSPLAAYLGDTVLDLEVTPNRVDCLSVLGVAREVAALTGRPLHEPDLAYPETGAPIEARTSIEVLDPELCPRYTCTLIAGVGIGPSPQWLQDRLLKAGMRPINNVVDVTNYVLLEYGQPLHAFDFDTLQGRRIVVRQARPGERLVTIDETEAALEPPILTIADAEAPVALGGVMGGAGTGVTEATTAVLLESASFSPTSIRRTARATGLRTEASQRFERGLRPHLPPVALRRATRLIQQAAGGAVAPGVIDVFPGDQEPPVVTLTMERLQKILGVELDRDRVQGVLESLGFTCRVEGQGALRVIVPCWRADVALEEDVVEEVARVMGYDAVPTAPLATPIPPSQPQPLRELREHVRDLLTKLGLQETISYSLTSREALERVGGLPGGMEPLRVSNPMSGAPEDAEERRRHRDHLLRAGVLETLADKEYLRTTLRASVLGTLDYNARRRERALRLYEVGRVYLPRGTDLPEEREMLAGALAGMRHETNWLADGGRMDFFDAKGVLEGLFAQMDLRAEFHPLTDDPFFHPGRAARVTAGEQPLGVLGEVHPETLEALQVEITPVAYFELDLEQLLGALPQATRQFQPFPRVPGAVRDLAIVVGEDVPAARVQALIEGHPLVARATLFDLYTGEHVGPGQRSMALRVLFQSTDRTLTTEEVDRAQERILRLLEREAGARLRS